MRTIPYPKEARGIKLGSDVAGFTPPHERQVICWLARQSQGSIVEIGCNEGVTTLDLAVNNKDRWVYGVDSPEPPANLPKEQRGEVPSAERFCCRAKHLENVISLRADSKTLDYRELGQDREIGFIFIDGDHSYEGVARDSDIALSHLMWKGNGGGKREGMLVWHDYSPSHPEWCGVYRYLNELDLQVKTYDYELTRVEGTWLVFLDLGRRV